MNPLPATLTGWIVWGVLALVLFAVILLAARACGLNSPPRCAACHEPVSLDWLNSDEWQETALCARCLWGPVPGTLGHDLAEAFETGETKLARRRAREFARNCLTCNGWNPVSGVRRRETKGLVCPTCGWDYGKDGEPT